MSRREGHGHHGGAWKVAYADFVTAMMALFIVLWILNTNGMTKAAVAAYFRNPSILPHAGRGFLTKEGHDELRESIRVIKAEQAADSAALVQAAAEALHQESAGADQGQLARSAEELERMLNATAILRQVRGQVSMEFTAQGLRIQLQDLDAQPLFDIGSSVPTACARELLRAVGEVLRALPNEVLVEGHTDSRPYARLDGYTNWELSGDRANAARRILEDGGIAPSRIARVVGYADRRLLLPEDPVSDRNRRISVIVCYRDSPLD